MDATSAPTTTVTDEEVVFEFGAQVRCDAGDCGAQARLAALFKTGTALAFCGHHGNKHRAKLEELPDVVLCETDTAL